MMATTHALVGMALGAVALFVAPEFAPVAIAAGAVGGLFPDFDMPAAHRRTLHFPVYYSVAAVAALALAALLPTAATVAGAVFLTAAAVHSASDALGGGLELRPWRGTSDRGVYDHLRGRWVAPRRWVRYDGAPEDLLVAVAFALPAVFYPDRLQSVVVVLLAVSVVYTVLRKRLVRLGETLADRLPAPLAARLTE